MQRTGKNSDHGKTNPTNPTDLPHQSDRYAEWLGSRNPAVVANALIC